MLLVNNPGSWDAVHAPLRHAEWHGWTFTDLIFPCFLWIVGVAVTLALGRRRARGEAVRAVLAHAGRRAAILFALGLLLAAFPFGLLPAHDFSLATLRLPGVLQRIALCYLAAVAISLRTGPRGQAVWAGGLLLGYALVLAWVPVPGHGAGGLEPVGNLPGWIDARLLAGHTWSGAPAPGFDPEGLLSTLGALATTLLGVLAGHWLAGVRSAGRTAAGLCVGGLALLGVGALLGQWQPINKNLWTPAYAVFMAGGATVLLAACHGLIDGRGWRRGVAPLVAFGANALFLFVLAGVVGRLLVFIRWTGPAGGGASVTLKAWLHQTLFTAWLSPPNASLAFALAFVAAFLLLGWFLWRRGWVARL